MLIKRPFSAESDHKQAEQLGYESDDMIQRRSSQFSGDSGGVHSDTSGVRTEEEEEEVEKSRSPDEVPFPTSTCHLPRHLSVKQQAAYRYELEPL